LREKSNNAAKTDLSLAKRAKSAKKTKTGLSLAEAQSSQRKPKSRILLSPFFAAFAFFARDIARL